MSATSAKTAQLRGLYAITDADAAPLPRLAANVSLALLGGARMIQYRDKSPDRGRCHAQALRLLGVCRAHGALFIVNDDISLAAEIGADGVHLGKDDAALSEARRRLGSGAVIGISCYDSLQRAADAQKAGADYVAFGRFFPSTTKPDAVQAQPALLRRAKQQIDLPIAAIGGITRENGRALIEAGADMLAVIRGVFGQPDCERAARELAALFTE